jgi:hypothetical protein
VSSICERAVVIFVIHYNFFADALIATRFKKAALCDVRNATQNWLSNSPDRIDPTTGTGGKKERMERTRKRKEQMFSEDAIEHDSSNSVLE